MMAASETPGCICGRPVPRTDYETGETGCDKCGAVLSRMQDAPHVTDNMPMVPNNAHATEIRGGNASLKRAVKISRQTDVIGVSVSLSIRAGCDKLGLPRSVEQRSIALFLKSRYMLKGRAKENVGAASVYMACREHSVTRILKEVCGAMGAHYKRTKRVYRAMCEAIGQRLPIMSPTGLITRMASDLGLSEKFSRQALDTWEKINATGLAEGKSPATLSACAIHMTLRSNEVQITMKEICRRAGITEGGLRNNARLFRDKLEKQTDWRAKQGQATGLAHDMTKDVLHGMYVNEEMSIVQISYALGCNRAVVRHKLAEYGIEKRRGGGRTMVKVTKDELEQLYVIEQHTLPYIAKTHGCSITSIRRLLDKHGIARRASKAKIVLPYDTLWKMRVEDGLSLKEMAEKLGCCDVTVGRNMRHYGIKARRTCRIRKAGPHSNFGRIRKLARNRKAPAPEPERHTKAESPHPPPTIPIPS